MAVDLGIFGTWGKHEDASDVAEATQATQRQSLDEVGLNRSSYQSPFGYSGIPQQIATGLKDAQGRPIDQIAGARVDDYYQGQIRGDQTALAQALKDQAAGRGTSVAQLQLRQGLGQAQRQALGTMASQPGVNPAMAARLAGQQQEALATQANAQGAQLRAQEMLSGQQQLAGLLGNIRSQDQAIAQAQQAATQQTQQFNMASALQQQAQKDQMTQYYQSMGYDMAAATAMAQQRWEEMQLQLYGMNQGVAMQSGQLDLQRRQQNMQLGGAAIGGLATIGAATISDSRAKEQVDRAKTDKETKAFLDSLDSASYAYKPEVVSKGLADKGRHWGVMAQSAAKTPVGRSFVRHKEGYMALDVAKGLGAALASLVGLNRRLSALERAKKG